jgi:hypothetical protein
MNRREFITLLGGAAVAWPLAAGAQQGERMRRICVLMSTAVDDPQDPTRLAAFAQGLQELGWTIGRNLRMDYRWGAGSPDNMRKYSAELAALAPDVMLASGSAAVAAVQQTNHNGRDRQCHRSGQRRLLSKACRGRAATPRVFSCSSTRPAGNWWSCSNRSHRA